MYTCPKCNYELEAPSNFCPICGASMIPEQAQEPVAIPVQPEQPTYQQAPVQPVYQQPVYQQAPVYQQPTPPSKAKSIVGMILSLFGIEFPPIILLYFTVFPAYVAGITGVVCSFIALPLCIIGMALCLSNRSAGDRSAFGTVGKIVGIVGIVLSALVLILSFAAIADGSMRYPFIR